MDVFTVERRDEGAPEHVDRAMRGVIALLFDAIDRGRVTLEIGEVGHQRGHLLSGVHDLRCVFVEQIEKSPLAGHQAAEHRTSPWRYRALDLRCKETKRKRMVHEAAQKVGNPCPRHRLEVRILRTESRLSLFFTSLRLCVEGLSIYRPVLPNPPAPRSL